MMNPLAIVADASLYDFDNLGRLISELNNFTLFQGYPT